mgnify:CR=1 FL=1
MKVLLDTHIALWTLLDSEKMPIEARNLINQENVEPVFSLISMWEIAIKHAIHPDQMPITGAQFLDYCTQAGFQQLMIYEEHVLEVEKLKRERTIAQRSVRQNAHCPSKSRRDNFADTRFVISRI